MLQHGFLLGCIWLIQGDYFLSKLVNETARYMDDSIHESIGHVIHIYAHTG